MAKDYPKDLEKVLPDNIKERMSLETFFKKTRNALRMELNEAVPKLVEKALDNKQGAFQLENQKDNELLDVIDENIKNIQKDLAELSEKQKAYNEKKRKEDRNIFDGPLAKFYKKIRKDDQQEEDKKSKTKYKGKEYKGIFDGPIPDYFRRRKAGVSRSQAIIDIMKGQDSDIGDIIGNTEETSSQRRRDRGRKKPKTQKTKPVAKVARRPTAKPAQRPTATPKAKNVLGSKARVPAGQKTIAPYTPKMPIATPSGGGLMNSMLGGMSGAAIVGGIKSGIGAAASWLGGVGSSALGMLGTAATSTAAAAAAPAAILGGGAMAAMSMMKTKQAEMAEKGNWRELEASVRNDILISSTDPNTGILYQGTDVDSLVDNQMQIWESEYPELAKKGPRATATKVSDNLDSPAKALRRKQAQNERDETLNQVELATSFANKMGIDTSNGLPDTKMEGGIPTMIAGKTVPDELYTDEQREKIKMAREMRASMELSERAMSGDKVAQAELAKRASTPDDGFETGGLPKQRTAEMTRIPTPAQNREIANDGREAKESDNIAAALNAVMDQKIAAFGDNSGAQKNNPTSPAGASSKVPSFVAPPIPTSVGIVAMRSQGLADVYPHPLSGPTMQNADRGGETTFQ